MHNCPDRAPEKGGGGTLEWPLRGLKLSSFSGSLCDFKDVPMAAKPQFTTKGN